MLDFNLCETKRFESLKEAASAYSAKLNQFLDGQEKPVQQFVKKALNNIFTGIGKDFGGYIEGKRPVIKNYGDHQTFSMMIQANDALKAKDRDGKSTWGFYDPVADYCQGLGKILNKTFDGNRYQCVLYNHFDDVDDLRPTEYADKTSPSVYPMVGCYQTGARGSYKNISKDVAGNTYSIIVSVPDILGESYTNPFMAKSGNNYVFGNDTHNSNGYQFTLTFDMADNDFTLRSYKAGDPETHTVTYKPSGKSLKAFKRLVDVFDSATTETDVEKILDDFGVKMSHSWWFNPYTD